MGVIPFKGRIQPLKFIGNCGTQRLQFYGSNSNIFQNIRIFSVTIAIALINLSLGSNGRGQQLSACFLRGFCTERECKFPGSIQKDLG